ncbi:MAG: hypothetical protein AMJ79_09380 [Phycisphaerae bacterium SM23_30]|nr:MAG: hypothetical protein AMJ79_09380 [Phycisphaerae bacterium SM23_30]
MRLKSPQNRLNFWAVGIINLLLLTSGGNFTGGAFARIAPEAHVERGFAPRDNLGQPPPNISPAARQNEPPPGENDKMNPWYSIETEKRKLRLMITVGIVVLGGFFIAVVLISLLRMGRFYRQRALAGKKRPPTDYVDAWSQYRLKDGWENEITDDSPPSGP